MQDLSQDVEFWIFIGCILRIIIAQSIFENVLVHISAVFQGDLLKEHRLIYNEAYPCDYDYEFWVRIAKNTNLFTKWFGFLKFVVPAQPVRDSHDWLQKLQHAESLTKRDQEPGFSHILSERWYSICRGARKTGLWSWMTLDGLYWVLLWICRWRKGTVLQWDACIESDAFKEDWVKRPEILILESPLDMDPDDLWDH